MELLKLLDAINISPRKDWSEIEVWEELKKLIPEDRAKISNELINELIAFQLTEYSDSEMSPWWLNFWPLSTWQNEDGTSFESPSKTQITKDALLYWISRIEKVQHPILRIRYMLLELSFSESILWVDVPNDKIQNFIDELLLAINNGFYKYEIQVFDRLNFLLNLSIEIRDTKRVQIIKEAIIQFESIHWVDESTWLWWKAFDFLIQKKNIKLSKEEEELIIHGLEQRLNRFSTWSTSKWINIWWSLHAWNRLMGYYKSRAKNEEIRSVLERIEKTFRLHFATWISAMEKVNLLDQLCLLYANNNFIKDSERILKEKEDAEPDIPNEMQTISHTYEITQKDINDYLTWMFLWDKQEVLQRIVQHFIPNKQKTKESVLELSKQSPLLYLIWKHIIDEKWRQIASIGWVNDDLDGHLVSHTAEIINYNSPFLDLVMNEITGLNRWFFKRMLYRLQSRFQKRLLKNDIIKFILRSVIIEDGRKDLIVKSIDHYFAWNYEEFIHLSIPQIEEAIRVLLKINGGVVSKKSRDDSYKLKNIDELFRDKIIQDALWEDLSLYFKAILSDPRWWNLRNHLSHWISNPKVFSSFSAHRVLHILLCLWLIRKI